jgi:hypothetical protein
VAACPAFVNRTRTVPFTSRRDDQNLAAKTQALREVGELALAAHEVEARDSIVLDLDRKRHLQAPLVHECHAGTAEPPAWLLATAERFASNLACTEPGVLHDVFGVGTTAEHPLGKPQQAPVAMT